MLFPCCTYVRLDFYRFSFIHSCTGNNVFNINNKYDNVNISNKHNVCNWIKRKL